jgi:hypothetical protein
MRFEHFPREHTLGAYLLGLLIGLGLIVYVLYCIPRGYLPLKGQYADRKQAPLAFWTTVFFFLLLGSFVVTICVIALWKGELLER